MQSERSTISARGLRCPTFGYLPKFDPEKLKAFKKLGLNLKHPNMEALQKFLQGGNKPKEEEEKVAEKPSS